MRNEPHAVLVFASKEMIGFRCNDISYNLMLWFNEGKLIGDASD